MYPGQEVVAIENTEFLTKNEIYTVFNTAQNCNCPAAKKFGGYIVNVGIKQPFENGIICCSACGNPLNVDNNYHWHNSYYFAPLNPDLSIDITKALAAPTPVKIVTPLPAHV